MPYLPAITWNVEASKDLACVLRFREQNANVTCSGKIGRIVEKKIDISLKNRILSYLSIVLLLLQNRNGIP